MEREPESLSETRVNAGGPLSLRSVDYTLRSITEFRSDDLAVRERMMMSSVRRRVLIVLLAVSLLMSFGCKRTPEDLEEWRNAQGGMAQITEWVNSDSESMEVRIRGMQIIIEEGHTDRIVRILTRIDDEATRAAIANGQMPAIEEMWAKQDIPELTEEIRSGGGQVALGESQATDAKDALYRLYEFLNEENQARAAEIFKEWMSKDQELRTQFGDASIPLLVPMAGDDSVALLQDWIQETYDPREVTAQLRQYVQGEEGHRLIDEAVVALAMSEHPELRRETEHAVAGAQSPAIAPYLERVISNPDEVSGELLQASLDTMATAVGEEAVPFLKTVMEENQGVLRWAAGNTILDAKKLGGLVDLVEALPEESEAYAFPREDSFRRYVRQVCNYYMVVAEREGIDDLEAPVMDVLAKDSWPAQAIGVECAQRAEVTAAADRLEELSSSRQRLPAWGERQTLGQFAQAAQAALSGE